MLTDAHKFISAQYHAAVGKLQVRDDSVKMMIIAEELSSISRPCSKYYQASAKKNGVTFTPSAFDENVCRSNFKFLKEHENFIRDMPNIYVAFIISLKNIVTDEVIAKVIDISQKDNRTKKRKTFQKDYDRLTYKKEKFINMTFEELYKIYTDNRPFDRDVNDVVVPERRNLSLPWRSAVKVKSFGKRYEWSSSDINLAIENNRIPKFNRREAKNKYLHAVAPRHSFVIDYFFSGKGLVYFLAMNINTRKAYAIITPGVIWQEDGSLLTMKTGNRTENEAIEAMKDLIKRTEVRHITHDYEGAFMTDKFKKFCRANNITQHPYKKYPIDPRMIKGKMSKTRANHSTLALIDRLSRTLRDMNYTVRGYNDVIDPRWMATLIAEYNSSPHSTLSNVFGKPTSPNQVDGNSDMEDQVAFYFLRKNALTKNAEGYELNPGQKVKILNQTSDFEKRRDQWLPQTFSVIGHDNGLVKVKPPSGKSFDISRWMLRNV